jgi:ATP-dependent Clp protease adaptor protein ClpS
MSTKKPTPNVQLPDRDDGNSVVLERKTLRTKPPQMFQVLMLNDDFTPMEFVVMVLQEFFSKDREAATQIMLKIHLDGKGVCGVYSKDVAATKVDQVMDAARKSGHPLQCVAEPID